MPKPKPGDIVWISGWGGVIGKCVEYDEKGNELTLQFPKNLGWHSLREKSFFRVKPEEIRILSAQEVFEKMADLVSESFEKWRRDAVLDMTRKPPLSL